MLSQLKITVLSENRVVDPALFAEQGLSLFVETDSGKILFDTGQTDTFLKNAQQLGVDLGKIDKVVLSHGHYDHVGGLIPLLQQVHPLEVVCHPYLFNKKFRVIKGERVPIGVPWEKREAEELGAQFVLKTRPKEILPDIWISGEIPRLTEFEHITESYQEQVLESYIHDELHDELALILKTEHGLVVLLGCGHAGPVNTVKHAMRVLKEDNLYAVVGGMHLQHAEDSDIKEVVKNLIHLEPEFVVPLHCTGFKTIDLLFRHLKDRVKLLNVGDVFILE